MGKIRVVQWATGITGKMAMRAVIDDPDLELVGVRVYDPGKVGRDAGELIDQAPTGIVTTDNKHAILGLKPDIVLYMGGVERHPETSMEDIVDLLSAGIDVVTTGSSFIDVRVFNPAWAARLDAACASGGTTFLGLGIYPGFYGEAIAPVLSRLSYQCKTITIREALDYSGYASAALIFDVMGYGRAADFSSPISSSGRPSPFAGTATVVAKALGLDVKSIESFRETALTSREIKVDAGTIPVGTVGALKFGVRADCGSVAIVVEHVTWMAADVKPEWSERQGYEIEFDGAPTLRCQMLLGIKGENHTDMGCLATAMHAVHAIPVVMAAPAGVTDLAELPPFTGKMGASS
jgi:2,4-diaminopentanoate dehydrogenase